MATDTKQASPLRVAQVIESLAVGGAEHLVVKTANHLAAAGHESHIIVTRGPAALSAKIQPKVKVHYLHFDRASIRNPVAFAVSLRRGFKLLSAVVRRERIAVVQTHLPGSNFLGLMLAWNQTCAVLATIHNNLEFRYGDADNRLLAGMRKMAYRQILRKCQGVIAVSDEVRSSLIRNLGADQAAADRVAVVTNAVEIPSPPAPGVRRSVRADFGVQEGQILILAAGRFCEQKNFGDLIAAAARLKETGIAFRLVIAGDGEERTQLEAQISSLGLEPAVALPGNLANLDQVMRAADIFVMSSLWEGLPLVLLEAMAAGLPVAAYGIAGIEEVLTSGETGFTVPVGEADALASSLARLAASPDLRRDMGARGKERIRSEFSFDTYLAQLCTLYRQAVDSRKEMAP